MVFAVSPKLVAHSQWFRSSFLSFFIRYHLHTAAFKAHNEQDHRIPVFQQVYDVNIVHSSPECNIIQILTVTKTYNLIMLRA